MGVHDRGHVRPLLHDLEMQIAFVDRLDATFQPVPVQIHRDDVVDVGVDERTPLRMDMPENQHVIGAGNARADMSLGQRPDAAGREDAMRPRQAAPQCRDFVLERGLRIGISGAMDGHRRSPAWLFRGVRQ